jgi:hypothetical protein
VTAADVLPTIRTGGNLIDRLRNAGRVHVTYGGQQTAAALATSAWLNARGLLAPMKWDVSIALDARDAPANHGLDPTLTGTRFHISIARDEWGFFFCHLGKASWIRVTDLPRVFERDDHGLIGDVPPLRDLGKLVQQLEDTHQIHFHRQHAAIRTNIAGAQSTIKIWVAAAI